MVNIERKKLEQVLAALETCGDDEWYTDDDYGMTQVYDEHKVNEAITAIKEALAQPVQEPFGWYSAQEDEFMTDKIRNEHERLNSYTHIHGKFDLALYTTPPAAQPAQEPLAIEAEKFIAKEERKREQKYAYVPKLHPSEWMDEPAQEPHSYCYVQKGTSVDILTFDDTPEDAVEGTLYPLYTTPPQRPWVGLTDEEVNILWNEWKDAVCLDHKTWAQAIEAKLKGKNSG